MSRKTDMKQRIYRIWNNNPKLLPKEIADIIRKELGQKRSRNFSYPSERSVQKYVKGFKDKLGSSVGEEQEWNLLTADIYEIPSEALKMVFEVWNYSLDEFSRRITVREAKWVSRLYRLFSMKNIHDLLTYAITYAAYEKSSLALRDEIPDIIKESMRDHDEKLYKTIISTDDKFPQFLEEENLENLQNSDVENDS